MLGEFPRPPKDNGIGVHGPPTQYPRGLIDDWNIWEPRFLDLQLKWFKVMDDGSGSAWEVIERLVSIDIMPIIRIYRQEPNPGVIDGGNMDFMRRCISIGAVYFETNNEPDLSLEWKDNKRPENWLDIVVNQFIFEAYKCREFGGYLLFPAFGPGGRENPFQLIVEKGASELLEGNMCLAIHNYCLARPLDYPNDDVNQRGKQLTEEGWHNTATDKKIDGPGWAWEMGFERVNEARRKYMNPDASIMTDSTCYRAYEYFDALVNQACGHSIPIFTTEGGYNVGQRAGTTGGDDARYPKPSPAETSRLTLAMWEHLNRLAPDYYFASMPWIIAVKAMGLWQDHFEEQGPWYTDKYTTDFENCEGQLPLVEMMAKANWRVRADGPVPSQWGSPVSTEPNGGYDLMWQWAVDFDKAALVDDNLLNRAEQYGLVVEHTSPAPNWRVVGIYHLSPEENRGNHNVYLAAYDKEGHLIAAESDVFGWDWEGRREDEKLPTGVEAKAAPERGNIGMSFGQKIICWVKRNGLSSDVVKNIHTDHPDEAEGNTIGHHSFYVVWKECISNGQPPPLPPPEPPEDGLEELIAEVTETIQVLRSCANKLEQKLDLLAKCMEGE